MITVELTEKEAQATLALIMSSTNKIVGAGDPDNILKYLESVEEQLIGAMNDASIENARVPLASISIQ